jgi:asparagine N-glycosylation enzyme membrane subunit Stt3
MNRTALNRPLAIALASFAIIAVFYLLREHWGHALGVLPYLLLLACPLLHLFHGHSGHGRHRDEQPPGRHRHEL